jgi:2-dehydropantoate 2-reductase
MEGEAGSSSGVAVIGPGAIGGSIAARLRAAGRDVIVCARHPLTALVVEGPTGTIRAAPRVVLSAAGVGPVPWVLLATKAHQTEGAADWLGATVGPGTILAVLQNGVEHAERVAPYAGGATVLPVVVECPAVRTAPGRILQRAPARLVVPAGEAGERFARLFEGTDVRVDLAADFVTAAWRKLCLNVAGGAITALTGRPLGAVRRPDLTRLARELVRECVEVGRAEGALLGDEQVDETIASLLAGPADAITSMLADRRAGRPLEVDARNGAVVRIGERRGIDAPLNRAVAALLSALGTASGV